MMLVNAMRLAGLAGVPFKVHWHQGTDFSAVINDPTQFFETGFVDAHFIDRDSYLALRENAVRPQERRDLDVAGFKALLAQGTNILVDEAFGFPAYPGEDAEQVARDGAAIWRSVPLAAPVRKVLDDIRTAVGPQTTAYHIRRGDILTLPRAVNRPWPNKYVYDELYQTHIEGVLESGARPILFSDDAATIARFKERYPALIPAATLFDSSTVTPGQADFLELLALASCTQIVAPPQSAFSSGAATLGEVPICDVETALSEKDRLAAGNRLHERLCTPDPTGPMGPGDIGQSLVHLDRFLGTQGRLPEARDAINKHLQSGLEISFLFPRLIELNLLTDDPQGAIAAGELMENAQVYHRPDYAKGQMLHSFAHLATGQPAACARLANIGFWHDPSTPYVGEGMGALYAAGVLDDRTALPFSPAARAMWARPVLRLPICAATSLALANSPKDSLGRALVPCTDPVTWDWAPFMRSFARGALAKHRHRANYERGLTRLAEIMPGADTASLTAIFEMHVGEKDDWLDRLIDLGARHPEEAIVQHRLSLAATIAQDYQTAGTAAEAAAEAAPGVPAHIMWRSATRMRQKRYRLAMNDIRVGLDAGLAFPKMHLRLATIAARAGHPNVERAAIDEGIRTAPRDAQLRLNRAQYEYESGNLDAALRDLDLLMNYDIVPAAVTALRQTCLDELAEYEAFETKADLRKGA
ncbi:hypothetical protein LOM8899_03261 [Flavimaricola marinus]|uniref:Tetratricopeptide repeat protein n=2 Tax=Flavimaricola marinus TaxID=1819565 RepID=A0A238LHC8_9RHOB|nr:hypothetical protein LOM8899_03261 [Flavimaricola marinus]